MLYTNSMTSAISLESAFKRAPRADFLPSNVKDDANIDAPLPIGFGQTNSQPSTVYNMLNWLQIEPGNNVLDVGAGSGWTTALLAYLVGKEGHVTATEIVPELATFGRHNCQSLPLQNITFLTAKEQLGYKNNAPYDRILVSAAAKTIPEELVSQLSSDGIMVIPLQSSIMVITKTNSTLTIDEHPGYAFVPLIN